jgi:DNA-binding response OmpR family regulator
MSSFERPRLLIVEDNHSLVANLFEYFEARGYVVDAAPDGLTGLHLAVTQRYDAIVLDWMLPRLSGPELASKLRKEARLQTPILMLTARDELHDKLSGFHSGADDYLTKPFELRELEVRLLALRHRCGGGTLNARVLRVDEISLDLDTLEVSRGGQSIKLYPACRNLLEVLMRSAPAVVPKDRLEEALWGDDVPDADLLRSHMYELRRAIDGPFSAKLLHTVPKAGYRLGRVAIP